MRVLPAILQDPPVFQPVSIQLVFETETERNLFAELLGYDISIPQMMELGSKESEVLSGIMDMIRKALNNTRRK